jgi:hypothetical protein
MSLLCLQIADRYIEMLASLLSQLVLDGQDPASDDDIIGAQGIVCGWLR